MCVCARFIRTDAAAAAAVYTATAEYIIAPLSTASAADWFGSRSRASCRK